MDKMKPKNEQEILKDAKALIADPDKHCKYTWESDGAMCVSAAFARADGFVGEACYPDIQDYFNDASPTLQRAINLFVLGTAVGARARSSERTASVVALCDLNNNREHGELMARFDKAIEQAGK